MPFHVFETDLGWFAVRGTAGGIVTHTSIGHAAAGDATAAVAATGGDRREKPVGHDDDGPRDWNPALTDALARFAAGEPVDLSGFPVATPPKRFAWKVTVELRRVPRGETVSYGELAARAGSPKAARAVGGVMRSNRVPLLVPCHRVVGAGGRLGGFSAPTGVELKKRLLAMEAGDGDAPFGRGQRFVTSAFRLAPSAFKCPVPRSRSDCSTVRCTRNCSRRRRRSGWNAAASSRRWRWARTGTGSRCAPATAR